MSAKVKTLTFESTGLLPAIVAADVLQELGIADETLIDYVEQRTQDVYQNNERFRHGLSSTDPRAWYRMWVRHWIQGEYNRREKRRQLQFRGELTTPGEKVRQEMSERDYIHIRDLPLYIDVDCYGCKRPCALSNTREVDGRHYCGACAGDFPRGAAVTEFLNDWPDATIIRL